MGGREKKQRDRVRKYWRRKKLIKNKRQRSKKGKKTGRQNYEVEGKKKRERTTEERRTKRMLRGDNNSRSHYKHIERHQKGVAAMVDGTEGEGWIREL